MKILVSGSSGLIGSEFVSFLRNNGHEVVRLLRHKSDNLQNTISWDIKNKLYNVSDFEDFEVVVNLAGETIFGRWTESKKNRIEKSRVESTKLLSEIFSKLDKKPTVFICASAIGYYGDRGDEILTEDSSKGKGFLASLCEKWEEAASSAAVLGVRAVSLRIGLVLSKKGGALKQMLVPFKMGFGGNIGDGNQYWSWITIYDLVRSIDFIITNDSIVGPVNLVSPEPIKNKDFSKTLGKVLNRPAILPVPAFAIKSIFGEMGREALLAGSRVLPKKLLDNGFKFSHTDLLYAFKYLLSK